MKRYITLLLTVILIASLAGCMGDRTYQANFLDRHRAFLDYSLGEFELIREETRHATGSGFLPGSGVTITYTEWELQFRCQNGEEHIFQFRNRDNFAWQVNRLAASMGVESLNRSIVNNYFSPEERAYTWINLSGIGPSQHESRVYHPQTGLQLSSVTPQELAADWGFRFDRVWVTSHDYENYTDVIERVKAMVRTLAADLNHEQIKVEFRLASQGDMSWSEVDAINFSGYYHRPRDTFETQTYIEIFGDREAERLAEMQRAYDENPSRVDVSFLAGLSPEQVARAEDILYRFAEIDYAEGIVIDADSPIEFTPAHPLYGTIYLPHQVYWRTLQGFEPSLQIVAMVRRSEQDASEYLAAGTSSHFHGRIHRHIKNDNSTEAMLYITETLAAQWPITGSTTATWTYIRIGRVSIRLHERDENPNYDLSNAFMLVLYALLQEQDVPLPVGTAS